MPTKIASQGERLRTNLDGLTVEEKKYTALLALLGPIRESLRDTMEEIEVIYEALDAEWDWESV